ncbi:hypothetical protein LG943_04900 [Streptomonospora sp. S1-112]|uniref:Uncharacterized protein n=1 Tax=Streptomonospora mangrovi TaxID=2883123 RepID=A0A9X3NHQ5_9ACTN|nr:hypothetical protein [Streptomonospora mangrovi]MDA0563672.1 hypothetical protein [Streptomonospora mangrovi]
MADQEPGNRNPLLGKEAEDRRRTRNLLDARARQAGADGESGSSGGGKDAVEALLAAQYRAAVGRGPGAATNRDKAATAATYYETRKRRQVREGQFDTPEENLRRSPEVIQANVHLARSADPNTAAQASGLNPEYLRQVQRGLTYSDVGEVLYGDDDRAERLERAAAEGLRDRITGSTPPEQVWRLALDDRTLNKMDPRHLIQAQLSAAMAQEAEAREALERVNERIDGEHPLLADSLGRAMASDPNWRDSNTSKDLNWPAIAARSSVRLDDSSARTPEQEWNQAATGYDARRDRVDLDAWRDRFESLAAGVVGGKAAWESLVNRLNHAKEKIAGFADRYRENLQREEQRAERGTGNGYPAADAALTTADQLRGVPADDLARATPADRVTALNAQAAAYREQAAASGTEIRAADPRQAADSVLPGNIADAVRAHNASGSGLRRPVREMVEADARQSGTDWLNQRAREQGRDLGQGSGVRQGRAEADRRAAARGAAVGEGSNVRVGRIHGTAGGVRSSDVRARHSGGDRVGAVRGDSRLPRSAVQKRAALARLSKHQTTARTRNAVLAQRERRTTTARR